MNDDLRDMVEDDLDKFESYQGQSMDTTVPALIELALGSCTAIVALAWFAALLWTPEPLGGTTWMSLGVLGLVLFGVPAAGIYWLRRGGAELVAQFIQGLVR